MAINVPRLPTTAQEFERMPPVKGLRIELWEGNLDVAAAARMAWHSMMIIRIARASATPVGARRARPAW